MKFCFIACFIDLFFEETMAAAATTVKRTRSGKEFIMSFVKKNDEDGVVKKEDEDEDGVVKNFEESAVQTVKNFQSAVQTFAAASNATSNADVKSE